jgi:hypothetical protein
MHGWDHAIIYDMYSWDSIKDIAWDHDVDIGYVPDPLIH